MKKIKYYSSFILEKLHINKLVDEYSDIIHNTLINSNSNNFKFNPPNELNIKQLNINICDLKNSRGILDIKKSLKTNDGWIIHIYLLQKNDLATIKHELNHAYRLTLIGKENVIKNLNHIKTKNLFINNNQIDYFFTILYNANDEEINSKIIETHGILKQAMLDNNISKLNNNQFEALIKNSEAWQISEKLSNFNSIDVFKSLSINDINKFYYILENNKKELDINSKNIFGRIKLFIRILKNYLSNNTSKPYDVIYKPIKGIKFYDKWVQAQGKKLKRNLLKLYNHYI